MHGLAKIYVMKKSAKMRIAAFPIDEGALPQSLNKISVFLDFTIRVVRIRGRKT
jgi:hypothetical protein